MRTISQFVTEDTKQLSTQLSNFEQNVVKETSSIRQAYALAQTPIDDDPFSPRKTYTVGQCARINTAAGAVAFYLQAPANKLPGEFLVVQRNGAGGFTALGINCKVNGTSTYTPAAGLVVYRFYFDGTDYWN